MTPERIRGVQKQYEDAGWKVDDKVSCLGFVSPCGRWFDGYDTATSRYYRIDGDWKVNLVSTKKDGISKEEVLSEEV